MPEIENIIETDIDKEDIVVEEKGENITKDFPLHHLNGKLLHVKVGGDNWNDEEIKGEIEKVENTLGGLLKDNNVDCLVYVTHKFVDIKAIL